MTVTVADRDDSFAGYRYLSLYRLEINLTKSSNGMGRRAVPLQEVNHSPRRFAGHRQRKGQISFCSKRGKTFVCAVCFLTNERRSQRHTHVDKHKHLGVGRRNQRPCTLLVLIRTITRSYGSSGPDDNRSIYRLRIGPHSIFMY